MSVGAWTSAQHEKPDTGMPGGREVQVKRGRGRPKTRTDEESRRLVVHCAFELFLDNGYAATSTNEIAARCRMSKRTFYQLFPSKSDLFAATVELHRGLMTVFPPHDPALPLEEQLARVFRVDIDPADDRRRSRFIDMAVEESRNAPELMRIIIQHGASRSQRELAAWLDAGRAKGLFDIGEPLATARILMDLLFGAAALKTGQGAEWPGSVDRPAFMRACIRLVVNGIRSR
jgi:AcrR family transcriptional regulator